jgi:methanogenic corrinoid protein MtbC1
MSESSDPSLHDHRRFIADLFRARKFELSKVAAKELLHLHPDLEPRYRPQALEKWSEQFEGRIGDLAAALSVGEPTIFGEQVRWACCAFGARGVPREDLASSLKVLHACCVHEVPPDDRRILEACFEKAQEVLNEADLDDPLPHVLCTGEGRIAAAYLIALFEGDRQRATQIVLEAVKGGMTVTAAYSSVLLPALREVGRMWHLNEISVAEEHFATATTRAVMSRLAEAAPAAASKGKRILCAAAEGNTHEMGPRVIGDFFEMAGWQAVDLGANVPAAELVLAAADFHVNLVAISAAMPDQLSVVEDTIRMLHADLGDGCPPIMVGGNAFSACPKAWVTIGADGHASDADEAVRLGERLVAARS